jgi:hypothetical protein
MKDMNKLASHLGGFSSGTDLGGKVSRYRAKQNIYTQGAPAHTLFYIQEGGVRLTTRTKHQPSAVTAILGAHDFFGELCLAGYPLSHLSSETQVLKVQRDSAFVGHINSHCLVTPGVQSRRFHMDSEYDLFEIFPDGSALWRHTVTGREEAIQKLH